MKPELEEQFPAIEAHYGRAKRISTVLPMVDFEPVCATDRVGEVCMVIRRPSGELITAIKTFYPPGTHRLLTGGIEPGESIVEALKREVAEETGLEVIIRRPLVIIDYHGPAGELVFTTIAFLLDEIGGSLACNDPAEQHASFHSVFPHELDRQASMIEQCSATFVGPGCKDWAAWGHFRAIVHRAVAAALAN